MQIPDPLPREVLLVAHSIFQLCGEACITGSAPLTKLFYDHATGIKKQQNFCNLDLILKNIRSNDVDIFAPLSPGRLADSRKLDSQGITTNSMERAQIAETRSQCINFYHPEFSFDAFEEFLFIQHGYRIINHKTIFVHPHSIDEETHWNWSGATSGIARIHNFGLCHPSKQFNLQLILVDSYPPPNQDWLTFITNNFDISIVKAGVHIEHLDSLGKLIFPDKLLNQIISGSFTYFVRPGVPYKEMLQRIFKYTKRGFKLNNMCFHQDCSPSHKQAMMF